MRARQVAIHRFQPRAKEERGKPVASLSFFNAQECVFRWSPDEHCRSLLVETRNDIDHTGSSYYGQSFLYLLQSDGRMSCKVEMPKDGHMHDVAWSPTARHFCVVGGKMPAAVTLYSAKTGDAVFALGEKPRNENA